MVITPEKAKEMTADERNKIRVLEKSIDAALREGRLTFDSSLFSQRVRNEIVKMYENAGWSVRHVSDQRDGDYFQFSERGNQPYWDR